MIVFSIRNHWRAALAWSLMSGAAAPALAQTAPPPPPPPPPALFTPMPIPPTDPARLAAAKPVIDLVWPIGTYARVMNTMMDQIAQGAMAQMFNMKPEDLVGGMGPKPGAKPGDAPAATAGDKPPESETLGQMAAKGDPYFQQRMQITMHVMGEEMGKLMTEIEPEVRDALAHAYARRFTVVQLGELDRFFATPTGHEYAADSMTLMMSPDMMQAMQSFLPRMIKAMPAMMVKVADATKDLPPPTPKKKP